MTDTTEDTPRPIVWRATLDGLYEVRVERTGERTGEFTMGYEDGTVLDRRDVNLAYGAPFGPDVADVAYWQAIAVEIADRLAGDKEST